MQKITWRKPQAQIDAETETVHSEYAVDTLTNPDLMDNVISRIEAEGGTNIRIIEDADLPADRLFRNARDDSNSEEFVGVNIPKAELIAHDLRRRKRAIDFAPHDEVIAKQIPGVDANAAETARQAIRDADTITQTNIDDASDEATLRDVLISAEIISV